jgi:hypothetical protein
MSKYPRFLTIIFLSLSLMGIFSIEACSQEGSKPKTRISFLDGSQIEIENFVFIYTWMYRGDGVYLNAPRYDRESQDFHYSEEVKNVELDRVIHREKLKDIKLVWDKVKDGPKNIIITLIDGKEVSLKYVAETSSFLTGKPVEDVTRKADLMKLSIAGTAIIEGQRGRFEALIYDPIPPPKLPRDRAITEIVFSVSKPHNK